jgi:hypothetical protein
LALLEAEAELGGIEYPIDDVEAVALPIVNKFSLPVGTNDE